MFKNRIKWSIICCLYIVYYGYKARVYVWSYSDKSRYKTIYIKVYQLEDHFFRLLWAKSIKH